MKKVLFLIVSVLILALVLTGCSLLSNISQVPATEQSSITYLTKSFSNLVGLWHFDEGSGTNVLDSSGNGNYGTITESTYVGSADAMFGFGDALSFDGNDYVVVSGSTSMNVSSSYTFEAWINLSSEGTVYRGFFRRGDLGILNSEIEIYTQHISRKLTVVHNRGGTFCYKYFTAFPLDQWIHLAVTWDGASLKAYYNNVEQLVTGGTGTIVSPATSGPAKPNYIGVGYYTAYMNGIIDEVRIWDIALTEFQLDPVDVAMDIKPGSCPNPLNVKNQGVLPVAILGTPDFDVSEVDLNTVKLEGKTPLRWAFEDVATPLETLIEGVEPCFNCTEEGPDGFLDLTLKFDTQEILSQLGLGSDALVDVIPEDLIPSDGECIVLTLTGYLYDGTPIRGEDTVLIIKKGK